MRKFTISKNFEMYEYNLLEERLDEKLPKELFQVLEIYGGLSIEENSFLDQKNQKEWTLVSFLKFSEIYNYIEDIEEELKFAGLSINYCHLPMRMEDGDFVSRLKEIIQSIYSKPQAIAEMKHLKKYPLHLSIL
ncbi:MAG: hypothetical protein AAFQ94_15520 [Bacteroidota bacterium]